MLVSSNKKKKGHTQTNIHVHVKPRSRAHLDGGGKGAKGKAGQEMRLTSRKQPNTALIPVTGRRDEGYEFPR